MKVITLNGMGSHWKVLSRGVKWSYIGTFCYKRWAGPLRGVESPSKLGCPVVPKKSRAKPVLICTWSTAEPEHFFFTRWSPSQKPCWLVESPFSSCSFVKFCSIYLKTVLLGQHKFRILRALNEMNTLSLWRDSVSSSDFVSKSTLFNATIATVAFPGWHLPNV